MKPKIQLALDVRNVNEVIEVVNLVKDEVEIIEAGTVLCLSEGMESVKILKNLCPKNEVLADIRIMKAGKVLSELVFDSGADIVTVISDATDETLLAVKDVCDKRNKKMQIELNEKLEEEKIKLWKKLNIKDLIVHRMSELVDATSSSTMGILKVLEKLTEEGFNILITGGIKEDEVALFKDYNISTFIIGRTITKAQDPLQVVRNFKKQIDINFK